AFQGVVAIASLERIVATAAGEQIIAIPTDRERFDAGVVGEGVVAAVAEEVNLGHQVRVVQRILIMDEDRRRTSESWLREVLVMVERNLDLIIHQGNNGFVAVRATVDLDGAVAEGNARRQGIAREQGTALQILHTQGYPAPRRGTARRLDRSNGGANELRQKALHG